MKLNVIFFLLLYSHLAAQAQLSIHAGGGVNFSNINFKNIIVPKVNGASNYFLSVRPQLGVTESIHVGLDFQFSRKGYFYEDTTNFEGSGYRFQYLDLIPQAQLRVVKPVWIFGGLGIGIRLSEKYKLDDVWQEAKTKVSNPAEFTYVGGIRIFPFRKVSFHVQFAGTLGSFLNIEWTDNQGQIIPKVSSTLNNIQLGFAYKI